MVHKITNRGLLLGVSNLYLGGGWGEEGGLVMTLIGNLYAVWGFESYQYCLLII
jgi:hypothetical protein